MKLHQLALGCIAYLILVVLITVTFVTAADRKVKLAPLPACTTDSDCEFKYGLASVRPIPGGSLIGYNCGPMQVTLWAIEEDEFPASGCKIIESA